MCGTGVPYEELRSVVLSEKLLGDGNIPGMTGVAPVEKPLGDGSTPGSEIPRPGFVEKLL